MFIMKKKHEAEIREWDLRCVQLMREAETERYTTGRLIQRNRELQTQLLAARAEAEANKVDAEELAAWRKYGQMRDPATGRLVPRVKEAAHG